MFKNPILEKIESFLKDFFQSENFNITSIQDSASDRNYFRITTSAHSYILTFSKNIKENKTFLYFSHLFKAEQLPVPQIIKIDDTYEIYLQEDVGNTNLLSLLSKQGESEEIKILYKKSLDELIKLQYRVSKKIDFSHCYDFSEFNKELIYNDLNYFKFYFFQPLEVPFSNQKLSQDFSNLSEHISSLAPIGFVYRDFQSRNIMVKNSQPYFIDYQGGMKGNTVYDLVSLLWQAKAQLSDSFKEELKGYYFTQVQKEIDITYDQLEEAYQYNLLIRLLQVLGAYGYRGILQQKQHFKDSILYGIKNLNIIKETKILNQYPELQRIIRELTQEKTQLKIKKLIEQSS